MWVLVLFNRRDDMYFGGTAHVNKHRTRCPRNGCIHWKNAMWFDDNSNMEKIIKMLYLRFAIEFEVERKWYVIQEENE